MNEAILMIGLQFSAKITQREYLILINCSKFACKDALQLNYIQLKNM